MTLIISILPIVITLFCGYLLVRLDLLPRDQWRGIETLSFRLLIPAILIKFIASSDLNMAEFAPMILSVIVSSAIVGVGVLTLRKFRSKTSLPNPSLSTLFQTTTRWNAFITLVAAELFVGTQGVALVAIAMAILIPIINVANIVVLVIYGTAKASIKSTVTHVLKNPLVIACAIGLSINFLNINLPTAIDQTLDIIGRAAIGVGLLAVGAGIEFSRLFKTSIDLWLGVLLRLVVIPILFLTIAHHLQMGQLETLVGLLILAVPAATNGYVVAKQMGGNAELYADILAWQVILSMLLLPLYMAYLI